MCGRHDNDGSTSSQTIQDNGTIMSSTIPHDERGRVATRSSSLSRRDVLARAATVAATLAAGALPSAPQAFAALPAVRSAKKTLTIGAKGFAESEIVANMYLLLLQQAGIPVSNHIAGNLSSAIATPALRGGDIDIFPEYTGTGLEVILQQKAPHNPHAYYAAVAAGYRREFNATWLDPMPMNDTQGFATTQAIAKQYGLATIADMVKNASKLRLIVTKEYLSRPDGLAGLKRVYGDFKPKELVILADVGSVRYTALLLGQGDVAEAFTTDGLISGYRLAVLGDPKGYAPPDNLAPVVRNDALQAYPSIKVVLNKLAPRLTSTIITALNYLVDGQRMPPRLVARIFLQQQGLLT
jgi:osmoprotectant transport system substrate-binding protein